MWVFEAKKRPKKSLTGGEGGIRTRGGFYPSHAFQACDLNRSSTSPERMSLADQPRGTTALPRRRAGPATTAPIDRVRIPVRRARTTLALHFALAFRPIAPDALRDPP